MHCKAELFLDYLFQWIWSSEDEVQQGRVQGPAWGSGQPLVSMQVSHPSQQYFTYTSHGGSSGWQESQLQLFIHRRFLFGLVCVFVVDGVWSVFPIHTTIKDAKGPKQNKQSTFTSCEDHKWASTVKPLNPYGISCHQIFIGLGVEAGQSCPYTPGWSHYIASGPRLAWINPGWHFCVLHSSSSL